MDKPDFGYTKGPRYGTIVYDRPLTLEEIKRYELLPNGHTASISSLDVWEHANQKTPWFKYYEGIKESGNIGEMLAKADSMGGTAKEAADMFRKRRPAIEPRKTGFAVGDYVLDKQGRVYKVEADYGTDIKLSDENGRLKTDPADWWNRCSNTTGQTAAVFRP
mgnify:FL=1